MLILSIPQNQNRLYATVYECILLRVTDMIQIPIGQCNIDNLIEYLENRLNTIVATYNSGNTLFSIRNKMVYVSYGVITVTPMRI
jgi:hypothetical protein